MLLETVSEQSGWGLKGSGGGTEEKKPPGRKPAGGLRFAGQWPIWWTAINWAPNGKNWARRCPGKYIK